MDLNPMVEALPDTPLSEVMVEIVEGRERQEICANWLDVDWFAICMKTKLEANAHKAGWDDIDLDYALMRIREETGELEQLIEPGQGFAEEDAAAVIGEASDVANFAFMVALRARRQLIRPGDFPARERGES